MLRVHGGRVNSTECTWLWDPGVLHLRIFLYMGVWQSVWEECQVFVANLVQIHIKFHSFVAGTPHCVLMILCVLLEGSGVIVPTTTVNSL